MPAGGSNRLMTVQECAAYLNVPLRSLREYRIRWGLPAVRVGRHLRFRERDVEAWLSDPRRSA